MNVRRLSALLLLCVAFATIPANAASPNVVISQVYGGGGGTSGPPVYSYDYVEIFNRSADDVPIGGWSVQYGSTTGQFGSSSSNIFVFPAGTSIGAGQYLTVRGATSSTAVGAPITGDFSSSLSLAAGGGKVALTTVSATLGCGATATPCVLPDARIVDAVAYGNSNNGEGGVSANGGVAINATVGALRKDGGCQDTDNNNSDFLIVNVAGGLVPRTAGTPTRSCGGVEPPANAAPVITAPANPITTVEQDAAPFDVVLRGTDDSNVFNWTATAGTGVSAVAAIGGASTFEVTFRVSIVSGFSGTASFTATLSDGVSSDTETVNIAVNAGPPPPVDHITISQVYGGGANSGAAFRHDYVELYNPTLNTIDVNGWSVQYASAAGDFAQAQPLAGVMPPGTYYLVRLGTQNSNGPGALLPPANIEGDINMSGSNGKVALVRQQAPLFTGCTNALIIDLVGYGSANCSEGGLSAPAIPGNTSAIFRKNDGLTDTNVNRNDFETGAASPRRTAPIAEFGPRVSGHEPDENGAPRDVSVVLFFNEPVDIDLLGNWYDISCATTGSHDGGAVASRFNNTRWIITPETNFAPGEQCTVTIRATFVRDQDLDDAPGTDTLASDYTFTFDIATGAEPPHAPSVHLTMGNPSGAETNLSTPNNYLMVKPEFALSYNRDRGTANWVSWHLADEWQCCQPRPDDDPFRPDPALPDDWYLVLDEDYSGTGFDRGHVVPNADRNLSGAIPIQQATFLMTNMIPQSPNSNQGPWEKFERHLRDAFVDSSYE
ncbi:MAG TPA: lamin tail domain-containing protein, partial [Thermoanaerobaculia bacterium]